MNLLQSRFRALLNRLVCEVNDLHLANIQLKPKEKIRRPKKCKSTSRAAAQPVTQKSLESKLSPEVCAFFGFNRNFLKSLLASLLDSKMDFESIIRRFNDEELKSIRKLNAEEFGKIMADVAIHLQTGDMWISALNKYRTRHANTITNRTVRKSIFFSQNSGRKFYRSFKQIMCRKYEYMDPIYAKAMAMACFST